MCSNVYFVDNKKNYDKENKNKTTRTYIFRTDTTVKVIDIIYFL